MKRSILSVALLSLSVAAALEPSAHACGPLTTVCTRALPFVVRNMSRVLRATCTGTITRGTMCGAAVGQQLGFAPNTVSRPDAPWIAPYPGDHGPHRCDDSHFWLACIHMR